MHVFSHKVKSFFTKVILSIRNTPHLRKKLFFYGGLILVLTVIDLGLYLYPFSDSESEKLKALSGELAAYELQENSLSLHYTLLDCDSFDMKSRYGLNDARMTLPGFSDDYFETQYQVYSDFLTRLEKLDSSQLSEHEQYIYLILYDSLQSTCENLSYPYYQEPLSPSSGEQTSLLILLAEYRFETRDDIEHYLELLSCIPSYFEGLLYYEQQKADAGLFMSDAAARKLVQQCDTLCTKESLNQGTHFLETTFSERLKPLISASVITQEEADAYTAQNKELLLEAVAPAYTALADGIFLIMGSGHNEQGLCYYDKGTSYYEHLLSSVTGSSRSPEEILALLKETFISDYESFYLTLTQLQALSESSGLFTSGVLSPDLPFHTPEEMLADLRIRMNEDFPVLSNDIGFQVSAVDDALSPFVSPAFYLTPPVDDYQMNQIYINYGDQPDDLTLYTTLAHEGYPGHLYQTVYHDAAMDENSLLPLEGMLSYGGYVEGWATYVEDISYEYAARVLCERCGYSEQEAVLITDFYRLNRRIQLCLYSILDISIHYYGMTKPEAASLLNSYGITDPESISWIYEYIVEEPACYLKYYLGYLEICSLKESAQELWGDSYSDMKFHAFFLDAGPSPFSLLKQRLLETAP